MLSLAIVTVQELSVPAADVPAHPAAAAGEADLSLGAAAAENKPAAARLMRATTTRARRQPRALQGAAALTGTRSRPHAGMAPLVEA